MTLEEFGEQMGRLQKQFADKAYSNERCKVLYSALKSRPDGQFRLVVDRLLLNCRSVPLIKEMLDAFDEVEEEERALRDSVNLFSYEQATDAKCKFPPEFVKTIITMISDRIKGKIDKATYDQFCDDLDYAAKASTVYQCRKCCDTGLVTQEKDLYRFVFRCTCRKGAAHNEQIPQLNSRFLSDSQNPLGG